MYPEINLSSLPSLSLLNKDQLPHCSAIYFLLDCENRVLYVGKARNLCARWKDHHRFEQLKKLNRKSIIKIAGLVGETDKELLDQIVQLWPFIEHQPPGLSILEQDPIPRLWTNSV